MIQYGTVSLTKGMLNGVIPCKIILINTFGWSLLDACQLWSVIQWMNYVVTSLLLTLTINPILVVSLTMIPYTPPVVMKGQTYDVTQGRHDSEKRFMRKFHRGGLWCNLVYSICNSRSNINVYHYQYSKTIKLSKGCSSKELKFDEESCYKICITKIDM